MDLNEFRKSFPIFDRLTYVNSCSQGALATSVRQATESWLQSWDQYGSPWETWIQDYEQLRVRFAEMIGAKPAEVAVVYSASTGINSVASALNYRERPKIVMADFDFPTVGHVWLAQERAGAKVEFVRSRDGQVKIEDYEKLIDNQTSVVSITQISYRTGFRSDVKTITDLAHRKGALVLLDCFQDAGTRPIDVKSLGVDMLVTGTLKYMLGPSGVGFLYVQEGLIDLLTPRQSGWFAQTNPFSFNTDKLDIADTANRFQSGTPPIPSCYAAKAGIELLCNAGLNNIEDRVRTVSQRFLSGARNLGIKAVTPDDSVGPLVVLKSRDIETLLGRFSDRGIVASTRDGNLRVSFHGYNTEDDADKVLAALKDNRELMVLE
ncbi:MAG TPA: aminotransferase class V-fold PLP-dependent enzyme [Blastocatellia bacterium]|nr:aminotransferase class V-fold PLP-dependent enzyme [Blastocatellia bacterium]